jgi:threonine dehydratase
VNELSIQDIHRARERIAPFVRVTPVVEVDIPTPTGFLRTTLKLESLQVAGSFKPRGAFNSLLATDAPSVVACSGGNHGLAVAHAAKALGRHAVICVPTSAAATKVAAMKDCGADVRQVGDVPSEAFAFAEQIVMETGWPLIHPYDQEPTIAGQGTLGLELNDQAPHVTHWLTAIGGGGFAAGVALALCDGATVVAVEPNGCPTLFDALRHGGPVPTTAAGIARTSLGAPSLGALAWPILQERVGACTLVTDADIAAAQRWLWSSMRLVAEPGGATGLAALMSGAWELPTNSTAGVVVCGGNADSLP